MSNYLSVNSIKQRLFAPFVPYHHDLAVYRAIALKAPWSLLIMDGLKYVENRNCSCDDKYYALYASKTWNKAIILEHLPDSNDIDAARELCGNVFAIAHFLSMKRLETDEYNKIKMHQQEYWGKISTVFV